MRITAEISMYPLHENFVRDIRDFILRLRAANGVEVETNQMSTQVRGEFAAVTSALNECMRDGMTGPDSVIFVVKFLNADLPIRARPHIAPDG